ncbi:MAG: leucine-rich repeat domain-containing protein [Pontiellaceae bacterium]|nr:leucine-rich repeat domain-containing protein [Pontiellaceae bacterium]
MRRIVGLIGTRLFAAIFLSMALAAQALQYGDLTYTSDGTSITITDCSTSVTNVVIPATIDDLPVTSIGDWAFHNCTSLTNLSISDSVISIGHYAFSLCTSLAGISIPDSVISLGGHAFAYCTSLASVEIGNSVTSIGSNAFSGCTSLASVEIGNRVTSIGYEAFSGCTSLASVEIGNSVTSIVAAFRYCTSLASFDVDGANPSFSSQDGVLFNKDQSMLIQYPAGKTADSYIIPDSVISISYAAFAWSTRLTSLSIPDGVTSIGYYAFQRCSSLASVEIGNSVTSIGDNAFERCSNLSSISIPDSVTSIGYYAFKGCSSLASIFFTGDVPSLSSGVFSGTYNATVYYLPGTSGWGTTFGARPALLWNPVIDVGDGFGAGDDGFGFNVAGTADIPVVIEACTNLAEGIWIPLQTNTLSSGTLQFNDLEWTNHPSRIYRISGP